MARREMGHKEAGPFQESDLKLCDLCGSLNLTSNSECFVCGWRGRFERRNEVVRIAMKLAEGRYGSLARSLFTRENSNEPNRPSPLGAAVSLFGRARRWLFG